MGYSKYPGERLLAQALEVVKLETFLLAGGKVLVHRFADFPHPGGLPSSLEYFFFLVFPEPGRRKTGVEKRRACLPGNLCAGLFTISWYIMQTVISSVHD